MKKYILAATLAVSCLASNSMNARINWGAVIDLTQAGLLECLAFGISAHKVNLDKPLKNIMNEDGFRVLMTLNLLRAGYFAYLGGLSR
jgi:hypothetical protein